MTEQTAQNRQDRAWIGTALEGALDAESPILRSFRMKIRLARDADGPRIGELASLGLRG